MATEQKSSEKKAKKLKLRPIPGGSLTTRPVSKASGNPPPPAKSVQKAAAAFKNFSLSRFGDGEVPKNYVAARDAKAPAAVHAVQRKVMASRVEVMQTASPMASPGISVALPQTLLTSLLPSYTAKSGEVKVSELLGVLRQKMRGTEFYAKGNPTINRVIQDSELVSQVQALIDSIKKGGV